MKALTIWQPWASLIINGWKPYEYRRWCAPDWVAGRRIVIHASKRPLSTIEHADVIDMWTRKDTGSGQPVDGRDVEKGTEFLRALWDGKVTMPFGAALGTACLGKPVPATDLCKDPADRQYIDPDMWAWPMLDIKPFASPFPCRGAQGFWNWDSRR